MEKITWPLLRVYDDEMEQFLVQHENPPYRAYFNGDGEEYTITEAYISRVGYIIGELYGIQESLANLPETFHEPCEGILIHADENSAIYRVNNKLFEVKGEYVLRINMQGEPYKIFKREIKEIAAD